MFRKLLIANRGEIACRIIRTARKLGIATVAVYSEADRAALHVEMADEAWPIGPAPAAESYLRAERIIAAGLAAGAEAVHPGYGFLSENAGFAEACAAAGLVFVGPPPAAIRAMGAKAEAKALMEKAGVPLVPGYHGAAQDEATLRAAAEAIGYPVLIKASAGGGGRGMRVVRDAAEFGPALEGARREALAAFGDGRVLIEKYLTAPRHIEIQLFADAHGHMVSLFERDCSIQRRHQKVIEEAPAFGLSPGRRVAMSEAAIAAGRAVGYVGAGTVEFIAEGGAFYFMEMNTRLQVEHPVTEMVTGLDLVEWQLRVAAGDPLPVPPQGIALSGHAIEARLYAEDPARDFLPATGELVHLRAPPAQPGRVRVDTGVREGDVITPHYDPMIAKLIVWGEDRDAAVARLRAALDGWEIAGPATNLGFLRRIAAHPAYAAGGCDTGFIAAHPELLQPGPAAAPEAAFAAAALALLARRAEAAREQAARAGDPFSPWACADAWRLNGEGDQDLWFAAGADVPPERLRVQPLADGAARIEIGGRVLEARLAPGRLVLEGVSRRVRVLWRGEDPVVILGGCAHALRRADPRAPPAAERAGTAPIPGRIARVLVRPGERVEKGAPLLVLEAMKMELTLTAPAAAEVAAIRHAAGEMVEEGTELVSFAADA